jgi:TRAP-type C4-dicarboxylate transport system permease small subunit
MTGAQVDSRAAQVSTIVEAWAMRIVGGAAAAVGVAAVSVMFATLLAGSVLRYAFGAGLTWSADLSALLFPWAALGGVVLAHQRSGHVAVEVLVGMMPAGARRVLALLIHLLIAATALYLVHASQLVLQITRTQLLSVIGVPLSYAYLSLPCGLFGVAIVSLVRIAQGLRAEDAVPQAPGATI